MLSILVKKQMSEIFRGYLYDEKKKKMRSGKQVAAFMAMFVFLMAGILGGVFTGLSILTCPQLVHLDLGWLYYCFMSAIAVLLGTFGCVFNTVSILYKAKDNDLMLSLPIPVNVLMASRMMTTYLMGAMYSLIVYVPAMTVYFVFADIDFMTVAGSILLGIVITVIVFMLSCVLGFVVAKISLKVKRKSITVVILSLIFFALYYFFVMKIQAIISAFLAKAVFFGAVIKGKIYPLYIFGSMGEGNVLSIVIVLAVVAILMSVIWRTMERSYIKLATATGKEEKKHYRRNTIKRKKVFTALYFKEISRFASSSNYMLNCGLGILIIPVAAVVLLIKGEYIITILMEIFQYEGIAVALMVGSLCMLAAMNDMTAPSVSLEGKNIWILQSLPVSAWDVLKAKLALQLSFTCLPVLFCSICMIIVMREYVSPMCIAVILFMPQIYAVLSAVFGLMINLISPNLNWTTEIKPIKQSLGVTVALLGGWVYGLAMMGLYYLLRNVMSVEIYFMFFGLGSLPAAVFIANWIRTKGSRIFATL